VLGVQAERAGHGRRRAVPSKMPCFHAPCARRAPGKPLLHGKISTRGIGKQSSMGTQIDDASLSKIVACVGRIGAARAVTEGKREGKWQGCSAPSA
jgi:hypothetical protein